MHTFRIAFGQSLMALCFALASESNTAQTVAEGPDHATQVLGQPWSMAMQSEVFPLLWTHNLGSATVTAGVMTGVARDTDPHFWLQFPPIPSAIQPVNLSQPAIAASTYNKLAFLMWLPESIQPGARNGRLVWHSGGATVQEFDSAYAESPMFPVFPGWHVYQFDLAEMVPTRGTSWQGSMQGLRLDPCLACQVEFKLDWVRLYNDADPSAAFSQPVGKTHVLAQVVPAEGVLPQSIPIAAANGKVSLARLPPGSYQIAPISDGDYALSHRGKAWSLETKSDFVWASNSGFSSAGVSLNGFSGTTVNADPFVLLDVPPFAPIEASQYRHVSIDMTLDSVPPQESGLLVWWGDQTATVQHPSGFTPVQAGRATYRLDLGSFPNWRGLVKALRIDPLNGPNAGSGVNVTIHSLRLTKNSGFEEAVLFNSQQAVVNARPSVKILSPDFGSGHDYASVEQGQAWRAKAGQVLQPQLSNLAGWEYVTSIPGLSGTTGSFFHATSKPAAAGNTEGDPHAFLAYQENANPINSADYRYFGFDLYVPMDATQQSELTRGAVARIAWKSDDTDPGLTSDDIVLMPGLRRYWFDMTKIRYEPASSRSWNEQVRYLRVDPFEFPESRHFYMGSAELRAMPSARWVVPVVLELADAEGDPLTVTIKAAGVVVGQGQGLGNGIHQIIANVAGLPEGEHALSVEVSDGRSMTVRQASVPIRKLNLGSALPGYETKAADRIFDWAESLLATTLGPGTPSGNTHSCLQAVPGAYGRFYGSSGICLFAVDGLILYTMQGAGLSLLGASVQLLVQATPSQP